MRIGIFYGSSTGDTERIALLIQKKIGFEKVILHNIIESKADDLKNYSFLIFGISTWGIGRMQEDWEVFLPVLKSVELPGKKVALFGLGDQESYPDTFVDALGTLYDALISAGCIITGEWSIEGYNYACSRAERDGKFVGLVLDEKNQAELTEQRMDSWIRHMVSTINLYSD
jgi:flavodoxin I